MRKLMGLFLFAALSAANALGQKEPPIRHILEPHLPKATGETKIVEPPVSFGVLQSAADEIFEARPQITDETLTNDAEVIENSMPAIRLDFMKRGFSRADVQAAALAGWKLLRIEKLRTTAVLSAREFVDCVSGLGMLVIKTTPAGADIYLDHHLVVDDKGHHITTEACRWPSAGKHHVKLILAGYETVEEDCVLEEEGQIILDKKLKPIEKKEPE